MAGMFVPQMVAPIDPQAGLAAIGNTIGRYREDIGISNIMKELDPSDPNSLAEVTRNLHAYGGSEARAMADRLLGVWNAREQIQYGREREKSYLDRLKAGPTPPIVSAVPDVTRPKSDLGEDEPPIDFTGAKPVPLPATPQRGAQAATPLFAAPQRLTALPSGEAVPQGTGSRPEITGPAEASIPLGPFGPGGRPATAGGLAAIPPATYGVAGAEAPQAVPPMVPGRPSPLPPEPMRMAGATGAPQQLPPPPVRPPGAISAPGQPAEGQPVPDIPGATTGPPRRTAPQGTVNVPVQTAQAVPVERRGGAAGGPNFPPQVATTASKLGQPPPRTASAEQTQEIAIRNGMIYWSQMASAAPTPGLAQHAKDMYDQFKQAAIDLDTARKEAARPEQERQKKFAEKDVEAGFNYVKEIADNGIKARGIVDNLQALRVVINSPGYLGGTHVEDTKKTLSFVQSVAQITKFATGIDVLPETRKQWIDNPNALLAQAESIINLLTHQKVGSLGRTTERDVIFAAKQGVMTTTDKATANRIIDMQLALYGRDIDKWNIAVKAYSPPEQGGRGEGYFQVQQRINAWESKHPLYVNPDGSLTEAGKRIAPEAAKKEQPTREQPTGFGPQHEGQRLWNQGKQYEIRNGRPIPVPNAPPPPPGGA